MSAPVLLSNDLDGVVEYMKSHRCKKIVIMAGAGISTSAGIPDFRSPGTGLYSNLAKLKLPYPEAVFEINFFRRNPLPFYTLAQELAPGRFRPTITHSFIKLLTDKDLLLACFTQNIDTLEGRAGVPRMRIVEAHGSFASQRCINCKYPYPDDLMARHIFEKTIPYCTRTQVCKGLVKPDIVFFGEPLPVDFTNRVKLTREADLLLIMGTSLTVHPFAGLADMVDCPRVLINLDPAGDIGELPDDVVVLAKCDDVVRRIADGMGWLDELKQEWAKTELPKEEGQEEAVGVQEEVDTITKNVENILSGDDTSTKPDFADEIAETFGKLNVSAEAPANEEKEVLEIPPKADTASQSTPADTKL